MTSIRNAVLAAMAIAAPVLAAGEAEALVLFTDRAAWEAVVAPMTIIETNEFPGIVDFTSLGSLTTDGGTGLTFAAPVQKRSVPATWGTWSGGHAPDVFYSGRATSVTAHITATTAFGLEMEPDPFGDYLMRLTLADGSAIAQLVTGLAGADFFGWVGAGVTAFTMSGTTRFAFGRFVEVAVPEPATVLLFGVAMLGLAGLRRRQDG